MKTIGTAAMVFFMAAQVQAISLPGWERPVFQAEMDLQRTTGIFSKSKAATLVMTKQDGRKSPTGFILFIDDQAVDFDIARTDRDGCGTMNYVVSPKDVTFGGKSATLSMVLEDHGMRFCKDLRRNQWEASITADAGLLDLSGYPQAVFTIQTTF
jgi:hypothetical protein